MYAILKNRSKIDAGEKNSSKTQKCAKSPNATPLKKFEKITTKSYLLIVPVTNRCGDRSRKITTLI